jgi:hypothetical protein
MMNYKICLFIGLCFLILACGNQKKHFSNESMEKNFLQFKNKEKFIKDSENYYRGIDDPIIRSKLNEKMNLAADDFILLSQKENVTDKDYQDKIEIGLKRFSDIYLQLDTKDRERVCEYFENLMDIVGLESSDGHLNNFMYGFNPNEK